MMSVVSELRAQSQRDPDIIFGFHVTQFESHLSQIKLSDKWRFTMIEEGGGLSWDGHTKEKIGHR
jgi:hypothetical protein